MSDFLLIRNVHAFRHIDDPFGDQYGIDDIGYDEAVGVGEHLPRLIGARVLKEIERADSKRSKEAALTIAGIAHSSARVVMQPRFTRDKLSPAGMYARMEEWLFSKSPNGLYVAVLPRFAIASCIGYPLHWSEDEIVGRVGSPEETIPTGSVTHVVFNPDADANRITVPYVGMSPDQAEPIAA